MTGYHDEIEPHIKRFSEVLEHCQSITVRKRDLALKMTLVYLDEEIISQNLNDEISKALCFKSIAISNLDEFLKALSNERTVGPDFWVFNANKVAFCRLAYVGALNEEHLKKIKNTLDHYLSSRRNLNTLASSLDYVHEYQRESSVIAKCLKQLNAKRRI